MAVVDVHFKLLKDCIMLGVAINFASEEEHVNAIEQFHRVAEKKS